MAYNWDKTKPLGTQSGADLDNAIRETREGVEAFLGTEHVVDLSNPTAVKAKHALNSARAGYGTEANKPTTGQGVETGRLYVCSDTKKMMFGNGTSVDYIIVNSATNADTVDGCHAGTAANNVLKLGTDGKVPLGNLQVPYFVDLSWTQATNTILEQTNLVTTNNNNITGDATNGWIISSWTTVRTITLTVANFYETRRRIIYDLASGGAGSAAVARILVNGTEAHRTPVTESTTHVNYTVDISGYLHSGSNTVLLQMADELGDVAENSLFRVESPAIIPLLNSSGQLITQP